MRLLSANNDRLGTGPAGTGPAGAGTSGTGNSGAGFVSGNIHSFSIVSL